MLGEEALGRRAEPTYRLYNCHRCGVQVRICQRCDHGQIYCAGECARLCRRECLRRAGARYQRTRRGALCHAARQRLWRARRGVEVTHQGYPSGQICASVSVHPIHMEISTDAAHANALTTSPTHARCAFCEAILPAWTRWRVRPWSG